MNVYLKNCDKSAKLRLTYAKYPEFKYSQKCTFTIHQCTAQNLGQNKSPGPGRPAVHGALFNLNMSTFLNCGN